MTRPLVFATGNQHKRDEISAMIDQRGLDIQFDILTLQSIGCTEEIPETADTIMENAAMKARYVHVHYGCHCFAEDTGLIVPSLDGAPGVHSARYAGEDRDPQKNMDLLLKNLRNKGDRSAYFHTVIALILDEERYYFKGSVHGTIIHERRGQGGFGYDPIFLPEGQDLTFGQMSSTMKNSMSHRARATEKLIDFLSSYSQ